MENYLFSDKIGHPTIQEKILNSIRVNRLPHAYLFYGKEGTGKEAFAVDFARLLNCEKGPLYLCQSCISCMKIERLQHPDVKFVFPVPSQTHDKPENIAEILVEKAQNLYKRIKFHGRNTFISIDMIRELKHEAKYKLYEGKKKVFIITDADTMRPEAANALLKILEEPPVNLMLILISSYIHRILPTIRSRCQLIYFPPLKGDEILKIIKRYLPSPPEHLSRIIRISQNNIKLAFDFIEENLIEKRDQSIEYLRKVVLIENSHDLMSHIEKITSSRDRKGMEMLLFFLLTWFRDALHLLIHRSNAILINSDLEQNIKGFVDGFPRVDYPQAIQEVNTAIINLEDPRNLNPTLIFLNLAIKLNNWIKQK
jgi:DNA polymerase-3 subunit delta'